MPQVGQCQPPWPMQVADAALWRRQMRNITRLPGSALGAGLKMFQSGKERQRPQTGGQVSIYGTRVGTQLPFGSV